MSSALKNTLTLLISLLIGGVFMWLAVKGLDVGKIKGYFSTADYFYVVLAALFSIAAYWFRAARWKILLEPLGYQIKLRDGFWAVAFGYMMNLTIPRSGEVARATALYGANGTPVDEAFGTIILERIVDLVCMLLLLAFSLFLKADALELFYRQSGLSFNPVYLGLLALAGLVGLGLFFRFKDKFIGLPVLGKIIHFIDGIFKGLLSIRKVKRPGLFLAHTAGIWLCYYLMAYVIVFALPQTSAFTLADGLYLLLVGTLGMMVPASGGMGAFHFALKLGVGALFLSKGKAFQEGEDAGLAYAFVSHTMQMAMMLVMGLLSLLFLRKAKLTSEKKPL